MRRGAASTMRSLPAPVGGWNARDAVANMKEEDAVILDNWFPTPSDVIGRKGWTSHATGTTDDVESLLVYKSASAEKMFAAAGTSIWEATSAGAVGSAAVTSTANSRWQHTNFATTGGQFLYAVNGADSALLYDGSTWTPIDGVSTPAITGVTTSTLIDVEVFKNRLWFVQKDTLTAWYLPTDSIGGTANPLRLNGVAKRGGELVSVCTWTLDAGQGMDDHWVAATSEGEIIVYKGTDPSSANTWALVGTWHIGAPLGQRCLRKFGGDVLINCVNGLIPLSRILVSGNGSSTALALTDKIQSAMTTAASTYGSYFGWEVLHYPNGNMLIVNVPTTTTGSGQQQYVMNTITGAWCRFLDIDAGCWALFQDEPYFGGEGFVGKFWSGYADNSTNINGEALQAFSYFGKRGKLKHFKMARPVLSSTGTPAILAGLNVDFDTSALLGALTFSPTTQALWDAALWDVGVWSGDLTVRKNWQTMAAIGVAAAMHVKSAQQLETHWMASDFIYENGGMIG